MPICNCLNKLGVSDMAISGSWPADVHFLSPPPPLQKKTLLYQMSLIHILKSNTTTTLEKTLKSSPASEWALQSYPTLERGVE